MTAPRPVDRGRDRRVTTWGAFVALLLLGAALVTTALPPAVRHDSWLPLHLALAGAAGLAIAAVLPFFTATIAAAPPAPSALRVAAIVSVGSGALAAILGYPSGATSIAVAGACAFVVGIGLVAVAAFLPLGARRRRPETVVLVAYAVGLADVAAGVTLIALDLAGWPGLSAIHPVVLFIHAWLNLLGFVSLVITATLIHLLPTVAGTRIVSRASARLAIGGLVAGPPLVAVGLALRAAAADSDPTGRAAAGIGDLVARIGAGALVVAAAALAVFAGRTWRARGRWTTDAGWHRLILGAFGSAVGWFVVAAVVAGLPVLAFGADPVAADPANVIVPLVLGWVGLAIVASLTHLLPSIGPGGPVRHARQRTTLGQAAIPRLLLLDSGTALVALGLPTDAASLAAAGIVLYAAGLGLTIGLAIAARPAG